ncbi:hypothetical protein RUND412_011103 [Rhizina undulata]
MENMAQPHPTRKILEPGTRFKHVRVKDLLDKEEMRRDKERRVVEEPVEKGKAKATKEQKLGQLKKLKMIQGMARYHHFNLTKHFQDSPLARQKVSRVDLFTSTLFAQLFSDSLGIAANKEFQIGKFSKPNFIALFVENLDSSTERESDIESEADMPLIVEENDGNLVDDKSVLSKRPVKFKKGFKYPSVVKKYLYRSVLESYSEVGLIKTKEEKPLAKIR